MKKFIKLACIVLTMSIMYTGCSHEIKTLDSNKADKSHSQSEKSEVKSTSKSIDDIFSDKESDKTEAETSDSTTLPADDTGEYPAPEVKNIQGLTYIKGILVVNKTYSIPSTYNPGVDSTAQAALNKMTAAASQQGISLFVVSGFRSYSTQQGLYNNYAAKDGQAAADRYSARPGHSEHQTGLAFDLNSLSQSFEYTAEGKWLAENCYKYGFIIRFPKGKESSTGYMYEPWHVRYLGYATAKAVHDSGKTLEEYLGITSVYGN